MLDIVEAEFAPRAVHSEGEENRGSGHAEEQTQWVDMPQGHRFCSFEPWVRVALYSCFGLADVRLVCGETPKISLWGFTSMQAVCQLADVCNKMYVRTPQIHMHTLLSLIHI